MSGILGGVGEQLATDILEEVFDEMSGRSSAKWGVTLVAFVLGAVIALAIMRRRGHRAGAGAGADPLAAEETSTAHH